MTTPYERAILVYQQEKCARPFEVDLALHLAHGYVIAMPDVFVMGRPVRRDAPVDEIHDPAKTFDLPDCWWVWLAAGNLARILDLEPFPLPYYGFERDNEPRFYRREQLIRHVERKLHPKTFPSAD